MQDFRLEQCVDCLQNQALPTASNCPQLLAALRVDVGGVTHAHGYHTTSHEDSTAWLDFGFSFTLFHLLKIIFKIAQQLYYGACDRSASGTYNCHQEHILDTRKKSPDLAFKHKTTRPVRSLYTFSRGPKHSFKEELRRFFHRILISLFSNSDTVYARYSGPAYNRLSDIMDHILTQIQPMYFINAANFTLNGPRYNRLSATVDKINGNLYNRLLPCRHGLTTYFTPLAFQAKILNFGWQHWCPSGQVEPLAKAA